MLVPMKLQVCIFVSVCIVRSILTCVFAYVRILCTYLSVFSLFMYLHVYILSYLLEGRSSSQTPSLREQVSSKRSSTFSDTPSPKRLLASPEASNVSSNLDKVYGKFMVSRYV